MPCQKGRHGCVSVGRYHDACTRLIGFHDFIRLCFLSFSLPLLEYCSPSCGSSVASHLRFLDRVVLGAALSLGCISPCGLGQRRMCSASCVMYTTHSQGWAEHPLKPLLPEVFDPYGIRVMFHGMSLSLWNITEFGRTCVNYCPERGFSSVITGGERAIWVLSLSLFALLCCLLLLDSFILLCSFPFSLLIQ